MARLNKTFTAVLQKSPARGKGTKVYVTSPSEKELFKKQTQEPVIEYISTQVGRPVVDKLLEAVKDSAKKSYAN